MNKRKIPKDDDDVDGTISAISLYHFFSKGNSSESGDRASGMRFGITKINRNKPGRLLRLKMGFLLQGKIST